MYDFTDNKRNVPIAKNALRKLRTTRHPDVLRFIDAVEADSFIYIMTEHVRPLPTVLQEWSSKTAAERDEYLVWGLHRMTVCPDKYMP
jgi:SCY1-like protein 1